MKVDTIGGSRGTTKFMEKFYDKNLREGDKNLVNCR